MHKSISGFLGGRWVYCRFVGINRQPKKKVGSSRYLDIAMDVVHGLGIGRDVLLGRAGGGTVFDLICHDENLFLR